MSHEPGFPGRTEGSPGTVGTSNRHLKVGFSMLGNQIQQVFPWGVFPSLVEWQQSESRARKPSSFHESTCHGRSISSVSLL